MQTEIIFAGFGGQGVLFAGQLLAYAAMHEGKNVTWIPSYGPEMRGGTANCTVVVSDMPVGSPVVRNPAIVAAFNLPSLDKYEGVVKPGGLLVYNTSIIAREVERAGVDALPVPANEVALRLGNPKLMNMVMLGALLAAKSVVALDTVVKTLDETLTGKKRALLTANCDALNEGAAIAARVGLASPAR